MKNMHHDYVDMHSTTTHVITAQHLEGERWTPYEVISQHESRADAFRAYDRYVRHYKGKMEKVHDKPRPTRFSVLDTGYKVWMRHTLKAGKYQHAPDSRWIIRKREDPPYEGISNDIRREFVETTKDPKVGA